MCYNDIMKVKAYGKLNLSLYINGKRSGYHLIDSIMHTVDIGDILDVRESEEINVRINGAFIPQENETTKKAALAVYRQTGVKFSATVEKHIPIGGGMGGSSADGAGLIFAAQKLLSERGIVFDVNKAAAETGSDVAFMLKGGAARVRGTGDTVTPLPSAVFDALVIDCGKVDTAECYAAFDRMGLPCGGDCESAVSLFERGEIKETEWANDLFLPACSLNDKVREAYESLAVHGIKAYMTGSGGCLFVTCGAADAARILSGRYRCFGVKSKAYGVEVIQDRS